MDAPSLRTAAPPPAPARHDTAPPLAAASAGPHWACPECDLLHDAVPLDDQAVAQCRRCGTLLAHGRRPSLSATLAWLATAIVLLAMAHGFPLLDLRVAGDRSTTTMAGGVLALYRQDMPLMATLVAVTTLVLPWLELAVLAALLVPAVVGRRPPGAGLLWRLFRQVAPWNMVEVFLLGLLVSLAKLGAMSDVHVGAALWALAALVVTSAVLGSRLRAEHVWRWLGEPA